MGIQLDPALSNEQACEARDYHGAVVTYQQVCLAPEVFRRACRNRKTLVILDELHHAGDGKDWGKALRESFAEAVFRLALSGTPFRSDNNPIPYVRYVGWGKPGGFHVRLFALDQGWGLPTDSLSKL